MFTTDVKCQKYKEDKMKVRYRGKYKYDECAHVMAIDSR